MKTPFTQAWMWVALCAFSIVGMLRAVEGPQQQDEALDQIIYIAVQPPLSLKISKDDYESIEGQSRQIKRKVPSYEIKEILYANRVQNYSTALEKRDENKYLASVRYFRMALEEMPDRGWAAEYCNWGMAEGLFHSGAFTGFRDVTGFEYKPAHEYYDAVLKANPKSRFRLECLINIAMSLSKIGKLDDAEVAFQNADVEIKKFRNAMGRIAQPYVKQADLAQSMASLGHAQMLELKEDGKAEHNQDFGPALGEFRKAQTDSVGKNPDVYVDAIDGELRVLVKQKDFGTACERARSLIENVEQNSDPVMYGVLPGAYMVLGKAEFAKGLEYTGRKQLIQAQQAFAEARWNFLQVTVRFFDRDDYMVPAHFLAAVCYEKRKEVEKDAMDHAILHYRTIVDNYPKHELAEKAKVELMRLGAKLRSDAP